MSNQEVLEKAIQKAIAGGWKPQLDIGKHNQDFICTHVGVYDEPDGRAVLVGDDIDLDGYKNPGKYYIDDAKHIIYNHEFAKALFGHKTQIVDPVAKLNDTGHYIRHWAWQYHLQQMVIAPDAIAYLAANI